MKEKWFVGVDIGGTAIKLAFVNEEGHIIRKWQLPTNKANHGAFIPKEIAASIRVHIEQLGESFTKLVGLGVGAPAFIDMGNDFVLEAVNIGWRNYPLKEMLEKATGLSTVIDNDANVAALGELWKGAGVGAKHILCLTLGTGIGGGVILDGKIYHGANGMAGEIGHYIVSPVDGVRCNCGKTGCIETVASATGIVRLAKERLAKGKASLLTLEKNVSAKAVFQALEQGDQLAKAVVEDAMERLGLVIANLSSALNPEKIIIGGGVSKAGEHLLAPLRRSFSTYALPRVQEGATFVLAKLGNNAGVIGAASLVKNAYLQGEKNNKSSKK